MSVYQQEEFSPARLQEFIDKFLEPHEGTHPLVVGISLDCQRWLHKQGISCDCSKTGTFLRRMGYRLKVVGGVWALRDYKYSWNIEFKGRQS